jgi:hypothetical protein
VVIVVSEEHTPTNYKITRHQNPENHLQLFHTSTIFTPVSAKLIIPELFMAFKMARTRDLWTRYVKGQKDCTKFTRTQEELHGTSFDLMSGN